MNVIVRIPLRARGGRPRAWATVDASDAPQLLRHNWFLSRAGYAFRSNWHDGRLHPGIFMAREVMGSTPGDGLDVDHINANKLDNRRANLRQIGRAHHRQHTSPRRDATSRYRGVTWDRSHQKWMAHICVDYRFRNLGRFENELEAAHVARTARLAAFPYSIEPSLPPLQFPDRTAR